MTPSALAAGLAFRAYALASGALFPFMKGRLRRRHATGFDERCGVYEADKLARLEGRRRLWIHAVSVGEVQAASPLVSEAARAGWDGATLVSTVTETGARNAEILMGDRLSAHIYAPWDTPGIAARACDALAPAAYVAVETEIWPNLLRELRRRGVPTFLLNARVSDRTWQRTPLWAFGLLREAYGLFDCILPRGERDAARLCWLDVPWGKMRVAGDCKIDAILERRARTAEELPGWRRRLALPEGAPCFVAGSTHEGEEEVVFEAFSRILDAGGRLADARLLLVPRHPERAAALRERASQFALPGGAALLSEVDAAAAPRIVVVDVIGVLYDLYGLATAAFVGGSLVKKGGQNILEPASWGIPIQHGPHMEDFADPTAELDSLGAAQRIEAAEDLANLWRRAADGDLDGAARKGTEYLTNRSGAAGRAWGYIAERLEG